MSPTDWCKKAWVIILSVGFGLTNLAYAGVNQWTSNGPEGGWIRPLAIAPVSPTTLYAGTCGNGLFKSTDGGASWTALTSLVDDCIYALAITPSNPAILYAGGTRGVFKSTDGGAHWVLVNSYGAISALAVDPRNPMVLYALANGFDGAGIYKSTDGGASWTISFSATSGPLPTLVIDPQDPTTLYAGRLKSTDAGASWVPLTCDVCVGAISALAIDSVDSTTLYVGTTEYSSLGERVGGGVFKSVDGGASWSDTGLVNVPISTLTIDPTAPATIYAGTTGNGVFKSIDGGASWTATSFGLTNAYIEALIINPTSPLTVYVGTVRDGVFKSTNGGISWTASNTGLINAFVPALAIDPVTPRTVYAGANGKVFKSTDGGAHWVVRSSGLDDPFINTLAIDPQHPTVLYAGTSEAGVFKSIDAGTNWAPQNAGFPEANDGLSIGALAINPHDPQTLYASVNGVVFKSTNGGTSWVVSNNGLTSTTGVYAFAGVNALAIDPMTPTKLYAATNEGVFKSTDGGASWTPTAKFPSGYVRTLVIDPVSTPTLYAGTSSGVFKSVDEGASWISTSLTYTSSPISGMNVYVEALAIDPTDPAIIYAGTNNGVFRSRDGGANWVSMNSGLTTLDVSALAIDPVSGSTLYAGTHGSLYAGTSGSGVLYFQLADTPPEGLEAFLESPENGSVSGISVIRGWAFATQPGAAISSVELFIDQRSVGEIPCCSQRGDVQAAFPQFPADDTLNSGWGRVVNWGLLSPGSHTVLVKIRDTVGDLFLTELRTANVVKPGDFEFLDQFSLAEATASLARLNDRPGDELIVEGVVVRDKVTQQQKRINARFRWFESSQSFGMVGAETVAEMSSLRSLFSSLLASLSVRLSGITAVANAQGDPRSPFPQAHFEEPEPSQEVSGIGAIRGWAFYLQGNTPLKEVWLSIDGQPAGTIPCCSERADVAAAFPDNPNALHSGWGMAFNYGLLSPGRHTLEVEPVKLDGVYQFFSHSVWVVQPGGFEFLDQFDLSGATARVVQVHPWSLPDREEIRLEGVKVRDKATQQTKVLDVHLRWFESTQGFGIVASSG